MVLKQKEYYERTQKAATNRQHYKYIFIFELGKAILSKDLMFQIPSQKDIEERLANQASSGHIH